jgi:hypothetical protein
MTPSPVTPFRAFVRAVNEAGYTYAYKRLALVVESLQAVVGTSPPFVLFTTYSRVSS